MRISTIALTLLSASYQQVSLSDPNDFTCAPGETITLSVDSNATTGYLWYMQVDAGAVGLLLNGESGDYKEDGAPEGMMGVGGYQDFNIQCPEDAEEGEQFHFTMVHKRPWEDNPINTVSVVLTVDSTA